MDALICNNVQVLDMFLEMKLNIPFSKYRLDASLKSDTLFFKLSWKPKFKEFSIDGKKTLYHYYLYHYNEFLLDKKTLE